MKNLANKTLSDNDGVTICKPSVYQLSIITDPTIGKSVRVSHMGELVIEFPLDADQCQLLASKLIQ
ncbi:MAG TPA: hypothetical protein DIT05_19850 [Morganella sp. (in: Bacteria)]|nr:hypothetical protein [Morganella sp. (in: enterobacteria)]